MEEKQILSAQRVATIMQSQLDSTLSLGPEAVDIMVALAETFCEDLTRKGEVISNQWGRIKMIRSDIVQAIEQNEHFDFLVPLVLEPR
ncbi:hypothetical protein PAPYR_5798 [Paratrimastix pyriformis]|uniref:Transcription factor CBF/NF-Y/archaeal histone domain-containing protein n=1 Tax=Paratrimastix pyriformis TaxID=342808 RepID=A0ABQ8UGN0_9EUKA|nr:hypothetical protein PAPYR_5798 [Paratrimastix pyriformis]